MGPWASRALAATLLVGAVAVGCAQKPQAPVKELSANQAPVATLLDQVARLLEVGDSEAWAASFTDDSTIQLPTGPAITGRSPIRAWAESLPPRLRVVFSGVQSVASGDAAFATAAYEVTFRSGLVVHGRALVGARREGGVWRVAAASLNADQPANPSATVVAVAGNETTPGQEIAIAVTGVFIGWLLVQGVAFYVVRQRLLSFLLVQINSRLDEAPRNLQWFTELSQRHAPGATPDDDPNYLRDEAEDVREVRDLLLRYLWESEMRRLTRFLAEHRQMEFIFQGLSKTAGQAANRALTSPGYTVSSDLSKNIADRVAITAAIVKGWRRSITRISDLPS